VTCANRAPGFARIGGMSTFVRRGTPRWYARILRRRAGQHGRQPADRARNADGVAHHRPELAIASLITPMTH
jgi:hypothetical protein